LVGVASLLFRQALGDPLTVCAEFLTKYPNATFLGLEPGYIAANTGNYPLFYSYCWDILIRGI
jgi:hypothetical protein